MTRLTLSLGKGGFLQVGGVRIQALDGAEGVVVDTSLQLNGLMITFEDPLVKTAFLELIERLQKSGPGPSSGSLTLTLDLKDPA